MAKQFLSDEVVQHIQDGYYATHEQDLTEDQVHQLTDEQLRYYDKQAKAYKAERKKKHKMFWTVGVIVFVVVVGACIWGILSMTASNGLYDENNPPASASTQDSSNPNVIGTPPSNATAGAKDNADQ